MHKRLLYMLHSTIDTLCLQPLLTDDESFVSQFYSKDENEFALFLDAAFSLMTPDERRRLGSTARTGRRG